MVAIFLLIRDILSLLKFVQVELNVCVIEGIAPVDLHSQISVQNNPLSSVQMQIAVVLADVEVIVSLEVCPPPASGDVHISAVA